MLMQKSDSIKELAAALSKAQGELSPAEFDKVNPHFKSKFASLTSVVETSKEPLSKNGLAFTQTLSKVGTDTVLETLLMHSSGEWVSGEITLIVDKLTMQGLKSAYTYARRMGLAAIIGVVEDEDDDAESTMDREQEHGKSTRPIHNPTSKLLQSEPPKLESYIIPFGKKFIGKKMTEIPKDEVQKYLDWLQSELDKKGEEPNHQVKDFLLMADQYLTE